MIDTIVYIPTILAYTFIGLLICILCFIVIYVSHKVYITIFDNLHIPTLASSGLDARAKAEDQDQCQFRSRLRPSLISGESAPIRKLKTVLEVSVLPEERHLAYIVFKTKQELLDFAQTKSATPPKPSELPALTTGAARNSKIYIKYYLSLSDIPLASDFLMLCNHKKPPPSGPTTPEPLPALPGTSISSSPQLYYLNTSRPVADIPTLMDEMLQNMSRRTIAHNRKIQSNRNSSKHLASQEDNQPEQ